MSLYGAKWYITDVEIARWIGENLEGVEVKEMSMISRA